MANPKHDTILDVLDAYLDMSPEFLDSDVQFGDRKTTEEGGNIARHVDVTIDGATYTVTVEHG